MPSFPMQSSQWIRLSTSSAAISSSPKRGSDSTTARWHTCGAALHFPISRCEKAGLKRQDNLESFYRATEAFMASRWLLAGAVALLGILSTQPSTHAQQTSIGTAVYEGARLIVGDG